MTSCAGMHAGALPHGARTRLRLLVLASLPIPVRVWISTRYWEFSTPDDPRLSITPSLGVRLRSTDFLRLRERLGRG